MSTLPRSRGSLCHQSPASCAAQAEQFAILRDVLTSKSLQNMVSEEREMVRLFPCPTMRAAYAGLLISAFA